MRIALLGAESTGKSTLAMALARHWQDLGMPVACIDEHLREWCNREGRTPQAYEQAAIALEQARRVDEVMASPTGSAAEPPLRVIADTTALMTAVYSEMLFGDTSLYTMALAHQRSYHITLLTGLDLPWVPDGLQRDGPQVREPVDRLLRERLSEAGIAYRVVYGSGEERLHNALLAIESAAAIRLPGDALALSVRREGQTRPWRCGKCSDPECEHRLFSGAFTGLTGPG